MTIVSIILAIGLGCILVLTFLSLLVSWWLEEQYGATAAKRLLNYTVIRLAGLAVIVGALLVAAVWWCPVPCWRLLAMVIGVMGLGGLGGLAFLWRRDRCAMGEVLLDLGHIGKQNTVVVYAVGGFGIVLFVMGLVRLDLIWILHGIYLLCLAVGQYVYDHAHLVITEKGLYAPEGSVLWSRVRSVQWLEGTHDASTLVIKTQRIIFHTQVMRIPWKYLEEVDTIIGEYLPDQRLPDPHLKPSHGCDH